MDTTQAINLAQNGIQVAMMVALPVLAVTLFVGLAISVFQAATQINEATLTFVPKLIGVGLLLAISGGWMLQRLVTFTHFCFEQTTRIGQ